MYQHRIAKCLSFKTHTKISILVLNIREILQLNLYKNVKAISIHYFYFGTSADSYAWRLIYPLLSCRGIFIN